MNSFETLFAINVNNHTELKNGLTYLSWAWAWSEIKKRFPDAGYCIQRDTNGMSFHQCGTGAEIRVYSWLTKEERDEFLSNPSEIRDILYTSFPIMDNRNQSIPYENVNAITFNKNLQRAVTKEWAYKGLGLYLYAGEDLPEEEQNIKENERLDAEIKKLYSQDDIAKMEQNKGTLDTWSVEDKEKAIKFWQIKARKRVDINSTEETF